MKYVILLVVIVVVAGGAYALIGRDSGGSVLPSPTPSASVSVSPTPRITPNATKTPTPSPVAHNATIQGFAYIPATLTVRRGDTISFRNLDSVAHTVTALNGAFDTGSINPGQVATLMTANLAPGTYQYTCTPHPSMRGTLIVQ